MTLDIGGSPFAVTPKPYIIAAVDQASLAGTPSEDVVKTEASELTPYDMNAPSPESQEQSPTGQTEFTIIILVITVFLLGIGIAVMAKGGKGGKDGKGWIQE